MKKFFLSAAVALMALAANAQVNLEFGGVSTEEGVTTAVLNLSTLESDASGIQCDVLAPEGVKILDDEDNDIIITGINALAVNKGKAWSVDYANQKDGSVRVLVYGTKYASFAAGYTGTEKGVISIPFDKAEGTVKVYNVEVANGKGEKLQTVKEFEFSLGGATGISSVAVNEISGAAYNVAGQKVAANAKGLVIMNGKKFINK